MVVVAAIGVGAADRGGFIDAGRPDGSNPGTTQAGQPVGSAASTATPPTRSGSAAGTKRARHLDASRATKPVGVPTPDDTVAPGNTATPGDTAKPGAGQTTTSGSAESNAESDSAPASQENPSPTRTARGTKSSSPALPNTDSRRLQAIKVPITARKPPQVTKRQTPDPQPRAILRTRRSRPTPHSHRVRAPKENPRRLPPAPPFPNRTAMRKGKGTARGPRRRPGTEGTAQIYGAFDGDEDLSTKDESLWRYLLSIDMSMDFFDFGVVTEIDGPSRAKYSTRRPWPRTSSASRATTSSAPAGATALYLAGMTQRVGAKGQVVIPKDLRELAGLGPGTGVSFEPVDDGIVVKRADGRSTLRGRFGGSGMAARLVEDRRRERP